MHGLYRHPERNYPIKMKSYLLIFSAVLLFGCAVYTPVKKTKTEDTNPSKEMGKSFVNEALQHYQFIKDPEVVNVVNRAGYRIVRAIGSHPAGYPFLVGPEAPPEPFALPGCYIF